MKDSSNTLHILSKRQREISWVSLPALQVRYYWAVYSRRLSLFLTVLLTVWWSHLVACISGMLAILLETHCSFFEEKG